ncbi:MAG TPA: response regulator [Phycisphaerae bacterium]|nr:response regulator [Phycisphaerae bacterium]
MNALVVDDDETSIIMVENVLNQMGYEVHVAHNGREALEVLREKSIHLVITDWEMPEMNGIELCHAIRRSDFSGYVYIIMITGRDGSRQRIEGLHAGADNFLTKPLNPAELLVCLKTAERILALETCELAIFALAKLAESRDSETGAHLERVQSYVRILAEHLSTREKFRGVVDDDYIRLIYQTSPLHDIGKVGIPDAILLKAGKLTEREFAVMKTHAQIGAQTLDAALRRFPNAKFLQMARSIAASHHEKFDGTGYPMGLSGENIPLCGRIVALADVYDALTSRRVYKPAMSHEQAKEIIVRDSGSHFDPEIVAAFLGHEGEFEAVRQRMADAESPASGADNGSAKPAIPASKADTNTVLIVEDDPSQRDMLVTLLTANKYEVIVAGDAETALEMVGNRRPRMIISDWSMPGINGTEFCRRVRALDQGEYIFFLIVTAHSEKRHMIEAFDAGVDDFVVKPFHQGELLARIRAGSRTLRLHDELNRRNDGAAKLNAQLLDLNGKLERLAVTDELTGLYNRRQALLRLEEKSMHADRYGDALSVAMLDIDHFKMINDTYGHDAGDEVLRQVAATMQASVRATDTVCRVGGEEFLIILPAQTAEEAANSAERCRAALAKLPCMVNGVQIAVTVSIGIGSRRVNHGSATALLKDADNALYSAKRAGRNCVRMSGGSGARVQVSYPHDVK